VRPHRAHFRHPNPAQIAAAPVDRLDLQTGQGQPFGQRVGGDPRPKLDQLTQPIERDLHRL
jgi:hypothetical protein